jgi:hypothetical protein
VLTDAPGSDGGQFSTNEERAMRSSSDSGRSVSPGSYRITGYSEVDSEPPEKSDFEQVRLVRSELTETPFSGNGYPNWDCRRRDYFRLADNSGASLNRGALV